MIILASASPRRRELLEQIGCKFEVITSNADEITDAGLEPHQLVVQNAHLKAAAVAAEHPEYPVLGSDTVVSLDGHIYGKPRDKEHAREMLKAFSGRTHQVITGIVAYIATGEPADKAGAYAIQGRAAVFVDGIRGSYSNVVGLPLHCLDGLARKAGIDLYDNGEGSSS